MTIKVTTGCTAYGIKVNDVPFEMMEDTEPTIDYIFDKLRESYDDGCISLTSIIELFQYDKIEDGGDCDQCGDHITSTYYEI